MKFGTRVAEATERDSNNTWIRRLKKGDNRVRFLDDYKDWIQYWEHYNPFGYSFPCTEDKKTCPGCTSDNEKMQKASRRYAANALVNGYVEVIQIPAGLKDSLKRRYERNGNTLTDRDYTLIKTGEGLDTEYDYDQEPKAAIDLSAYQDKKHDVQQLLQQQFKDAWPDFPMDGGEEVEVKKVPNPGGTRAALAAASKPQGSTEDPPSEPAATSDQPQQESNGSTDVTVDQLREMRLVEIHSLLDQDPDVKGKYPDDVPKSELIDWLVEHYS